MLEEVPHSLTNTGEEDEEILEITEIVQQPVRRKLKQKKPFKKSLVTGLTEDELFAGLAVLVARRGESNFLAATIIEHNPLRETLKWKIVWDSSKKSDWVKFDG